MFKNVPDGYNEAFNEMIEDFKYFIKNNIEIIKKENKNIENYKIKKLRKEDRTEFYTKNIKIIFKDLNLDLKYNIERMYNNNEKFESNIKKCLFLLFLNIYYKINKNLSSLRNSEIVNNLFYIEKNYFYFFYDEKSGHFLNNSDLINYYYIIDKFEKKLYIANEKKYFKKFKKINKDIINFFINEEKENIFNVNIKNKNIFYNLKNNTFSNFDDNLEIFNEELTFIKNNIKELNLNPDIQNTVYYTKNKNIEKLKYNTNEIIYLKNKKIKFLNYSKFIYNNKEHYGYFIKDGVILYDENVNEIKIDISNIIEKNSSSLTLIKRYEIKEIKNNTFLALKNKQELNGDINCSFYDFDKKIHFLNFKNEYNLIGIFLNCEFFIVNKNFEFIQGKNNKKIYKKLINNFDELIKENRKNNLLINI